MARSFRNRMTLLLLVIFPTLMAGFAAANPTPATTAATGAYKIRLPLLTDISASPLSVFGAEVTRGGVQHIGNRAGEAGLAWTRYNGVVWSEVEPTRGAPDFSKLSGVDAELLGLVRQGLRPILIVRGVPGWAQQRPPYSCGAINNGAFGDFARFMQQIVARYSAPPFNIQHFELGNEVDIDPSLVGQDAHYGCWGDLNDPYYGGGRYGEMLKVVYPAVKQVNPAAQVVFGGLLLDCDVTRRADCKAANFFEGALRAGAGASFDVMAYHGYTFWHSGMAAQDWDLYNPEWGIPSNRRGRVLGKLDFLREVMARYNINKPVMMNEGGLLCAPGATCSENIRPVQANYVVRLYSRSIANGLTASIWYTLDYPGWYNGSLLDQFGGGRPAYETLKWMSIKMAGGQFAGTISTGQLEGYAIRSGGKTYRVYWTNDGSTVPVAVPAGAVYNMYGQPIAYSGSVGFEPIFVESDS